MCQEKLFQMGIKKKKFFSELSHFFFKKVKSLIPKYIIISMFYIKMNILQLNLEAEHDS